ncbi:hypothetical protein VTN00DRAFT_4842 [Thermoascus crustaceus]|uniref:uncharacterized protein n=1 Tax=Thermoascus crustaceus TaxID=5088 RepID=UPI003743D8A4
MSMILKSDSWARTVGQEVIFVYIESSSDFCNRHPQASRCTFCTAALLRKDRGAKTPRPRSLVSLHPSLEEEIPTTRNNRNVLRRSHVSKCRVLHPPPFVENTPPRSSG